MIKLKSLLGVKRGTPRKRSTSVSADAPLTRWIGPIFTVVGLLVGLGYVIAGKVDLSALDQFAATEGSLESVSTRAVRLDLPAAKSSETIRVATFHMDRLSAGIPATPDQIATLAQVFSRYDVIAVQGIDGSDPTPIESATAAIRMSGGRYLSSVSPAIGRFGNGESYAFVWDETRIRPLPDSTGIVQDTSDRLMFEPMYASFETRVGFTDGRRPFRFTLINTHAIAPSRDLASIEANVLDDVFVSVRNYGYETAGEEDCILLGDLGAGVDRLFELGQIPGVRSIAGRIDSNQHIMLDPYYTAEYTGQSGLLDLQAQPAITREQLASISSQLPLWAEFSVHEIPTTPNVAVNH